MWVRYRLSNEKLLRRMGPFLALNRPGAMSALQPLSGGKRTHCGHVATAVFDPYETSRLSPWEHFAADLGCPLECRQSGDNRTRQLSRCDCDAASHLGATCDWDPEVLRSRAEWSVAGRVLNCDQVS